MLHQRASKLWATRLDGDVDAGGTEVRPWPIRFDTESRRRPARPPVPRRGGGGGEVRNEQPDAGRRPSPSNSTGSYASGVSSTAVEIRDGEHRVEPAETRLRDNVQEGQQLVADGTCKVPDRIEVETLQELIVTHVTTPGVHSD